MPADRSPPGTATLTPVVLQILLALAENNRHGYGIKLEIERLTDGAMSLGSGTLYEAIQRLENSGLVGEAPVPRGESGDSRRRRYYKLTVGGRRALQTELSRLEKVLSHARSKKLIPKTR
jgi:DNA-binding PadR family transcriptional regulator